MPEQLSRGGPLDWLRKFGLDPNSLDPEMQALAIRLGEKGLKELTEERQRLLSQRPALYRGERLTREEALSRLEQTARLEQTGGRWNDGEPSLGQDPSSWIDDEMGYLTDGILNSDER